MASDRGIHMLELAIAALVISLIAGALGFTGVNLTIPHKETAVSLVDRATAYTSKLLQCAPASRQATNLGEVTGGLPAREELRLHVSSLAGVSVKARESYYARAVTS